MKAPAGLIALLSLLAFAACTEPEAQTLESVGTHRVIVEAAPSTHVETQRVTPEIIRTSLATSGSIRARRVTAISAEVAGRLTEVLVDVGDYVEQGQPLFQVDPVPYEMALAETRAGLALARAESANAAQEAERMRKLVTKRIASEQDFEKLRTAAAVARARVDQMEARVARAKRDLDRSLVRAAYAGSIVERRAHEGAMVGPEPILVLQETGALEVVLAIPEAWPARVRAGDAIQLYVEGLAEPIETRVHRVSERVDAEARTYEVRAPVRVSPQTLKAGSYVRANILVGSPKPTLVVNRSALLIRDGRKYVFRVSGETVERLPVRVGVTNTERAEILSGLESGDEVVIGEDAVARLQDGARIRRGTSLSTARLEETP